MWKYEIHLKNGETHTIELDQPIEKMFEISDELRVELKLRKCQKSRKVDENG